MQKYILFAFYLMTTLLTKIVKQTFEYHFFLNFIFANLFKFPLNNLNSIYKFN